MAGSGSWWQRLRRALGLPAGGGGFAGLRAAHLRLGRRGERLACRLLRESGLAILARNYGGAHGEIDIVAREGNVLCFVEVKTRRRAGAARPGAAVGAEKRRRLRRTARQYLREAGWPAVPYRFDIVELLLAGRRPRELGWHRGAFTDREDRPGDAWHAPAD
ncbi:MAG: YraN family protein [Lentisphaeria bacterium]|jgi:putative endonuclease